jgi:hypothetical protein
MGDAMGMFDAPVGVTGVGLRLWLNPTYRQAAAIP